MKTIAEGSLSFTFGDDLLVSKHDDSPFHRTRFHHVAGSSKALDFFVVERPAHCLWALEVKDYRPGGTDPDPEKLAVGVATKVRDSLAALVVARISTTGEERAVAEAALDCDRIRVVCHLELPETEARLHSADTVAAAVQQKLRTRVWPIDAEAAVVRVGSPIPLPWTVTDKRPAA